MVFRNPNWFHDPKYGLEGQEGPYRVQGVILGQLSRLGHTWSYWVISGQLGHTRLNRLI